MVDNKEISQKEIHEDIIKYKAMDTDKIDQQYDEVADRYDQYAETLGYPEPEKVADAIERVCEIPKDAKINDFGAGTGLVADSLAKRGYTHIDGCDASQKMLDVAKEKGIMKDIRCMFLCKQEIPEEWKGVYDVVCSVGLMTFDHCHASVLEEKYSVLRPGGAGIIIFTTRPKYMQELKYQEKIDEMTAEGRLEFIEALPFTRYYKSDVSEAKDSRFKPVEGNCYIYRAKWPA